MIIFCLSAGFEKEELRGSFIGLDPIDLTHQMVTRTEELVEGQIGISVDNSMRAASHLLTDAQLTLFL